MRDRDAATLDHVLPDLEGATFKRILMPVVASDALLITDGRVAYSQLADEAGLLHIALNASAGERTYVQLSHPEHQRQVSLLSMSTCLTLAEPKSKLVEVRNLPSISASGVSPEWFEAAKKSAAGHRSNVSIRE